VNAFVLNVKCSAARYAFIPLSILGFIILFNRSTYWVGIWPEAGAAVAVSGFFISLFSAGISGWATARREHQGLIEQASSGTVRPYVLDTSAFLGDLVWFVSAYLVVSTVAFVVTAAGGFPPGAPSYLGYSALGLVLVVVSSSWGWLAGRFLDPVVAGLVAALSWFIGLSLVGDQVDAAPVSGPPWYTVQLDVVAFRLAAALLLLLALCGVRRVSLGHGSSRSAAQATGAVATVLAAILVVAAHVYSPVLTPRAPVAAPLCVQGQMQYCLWPEHEKYIALVRQADERVAALPLKLPLPERVVDYSLSGATQWVDGVEMELAGDFPPEFDISEGSRWALARGLATAITRSVFADCEVPEALEDPEHRWDQLHAWIEARLAGPGGPDYTTNAPEETQSAWAEGYSVASQLTDSQQAAWAADLIEARFLEFCRDR
jgi:hypothetical protein